MASGSADGPGPVDWLTAGPALTPPGRHRRRILTGILLLALVAAVLGPALWARDRQDELARSRPTATSTPGPTRAATTSPSPGTRPVVLQTSGPLLRGLRTEWVLFARSANIVYRIEVLSGRVTATYVGSLPTTGPVTFLADARGVILRPLDDVVGVAVPNGQSARPLRGWLERAGYSLPGPPGSVWVESGQSRAGQTTAMRLIRFDGTATPVSVRATTGSFRSDGAGGLLLDDVGGVWEAGPGGMRRVTTGGVAAVGPGHYLLVHCDERHSCHSSLYDRRNRTERRLNTPYPARWFGGAVSPDGRYVTSTQYDGQTPSMTLEVTDLRSARTLVRTTGPEDSEAQPLWSPDGRWLAVVLEGRLSFLDLRSGRRVTPRLNLPRLLQLTSPTRS